MNQAARSQVVFTNKARCRDCYRCVRVCPVKAIQMHAGQARVIEARCIGCGTCIRECPQGAKGYRNDVDRARRIVAGYPRTAVSMAPSFAGVFPEWQRKRLPSALRRLGFRYVGETAVGAYHVARKTAEWVERQPHRAHVCTACPAVVRFVERYRPNLVDDLVPVVSPMLAHGRMIRERLGDDAKVVFIGPCVAKKTEAERPEHAGIIDCVLTFRELEEWLAQEGIDLSECEESEFDDAPEGQSRLFALEGGSVRTAGWTADVLEANIVVASGFDEVCSALDSIGASPEPVVVEPLLCPQGCINGPAIPGDENQYHRRSAVLSFAAAHPGRTPQGPVNGHLATRFRAMSADDEPAIREEDIRAVLEKTGKARDEDQLNCGACGYASCRAKAIAVIRGLAEPEMCMPFMKRLAEQRTDRIIETSPNGIVILDDRLRILHMNPAFRRYFLCSDALCGQPISRLMDPGPFERLTVGQDKVVELTAEHANYNLVCHQILYPLGEEGQYVGIFVNITNSRQSQQKLDQLRAETVAQARDLLNQQLDMAETIARCLGESTARGEDLLDKLVRMAEGDEGNGGADRWLKDTYTSK
jgi:iron only hydrogenase large subunit-like protein/uncharacterized Fe-S cluster-containing protein